MIVVEGARVIYPNGTQALKPCTLQFVPGAFTVLLGASGAGKSTLLRSLNGLVPLTEGRITVEGRDIAASLRQHRARTGMIFQQHQLIGRRSVLGNVLMGRLGHHAALRTLLPWRLSEKRMALDAIERVGLLAYALRRADELSGGQQQRVGIARALVQQPSTILADEPVASLDPTTAVRVLADLHEICRQDGLTAIVSLHQLDLAHRFADRIIGIASGAVIFDGPPEALREADIGRIYGTTPQPALVLEIA